MHEPFFTTEADEMSRAFDPVNTDSPAQAGSSAAKSPPPEIEASEPGLPDPAEERNSAPLRRAVTQHSVCPFCGTINQGAPKPCRQCGMENNQSTRNATRSKIGPWFVWQARNPAAPGMNWATLAALVEKARITPRSVVRGPTTGQLWRFAARVKGLSREFGLCWHCGGELQRTARLCASCKRLQQPPANPDVLLETADATQAQARPPLRDPKDGGLLSLIPEPVRKETPATHEAPPEPQGEPAARDLSTKGMASQRPPLPHHQPIAAALDPMVDHGLPVVDMGNDPMPSGVEMRAFQFPGDYARGEFHPKSLFRRLLIAALLALVALAGGLYFNPQVRPHYERLFRSLMNRAHGANGERAPVIKSEPKSPHAVLRSSSTPLMGLSRDSTPPPATTPSPKTEITLGPGSSTDSPLPAAKTLTPPESSPTAIPDTANIKITPPPTDPQAAERRAWELYERAIKAEQRADYDAAVKEYEWIAQLRLPDGMGPLDVDARLARARQQARSKD